MHYWEIFQADQCPFSDFFPHKSGIYNYIKKDYIYCQTKSTFFRQYKVHNRVNEQWQTKLHIFFIPWGCLAKVRFPKCCDYESSTQQCFDVKEDRNTQQCFDVKQPGIWIILMIYFSMLIMENKENYWFVRLHIGIELRKACDNPTPFGLIQSALEGSIFRSW